MNERLYLHAVLRFDRYLLSATDDPAALVTVVAVVPTREEADAEVLRLTGLRAGDGDITYFWSPARYFPNGRGVGA